MARKKISEYCAKQILFSYIGEEYSGISIELDLNNNSIINQKDIDQLDSDKTYVLKVDQGIKKRGKQGLIKINIQKKSLKKHIQELQKKGFSQFLIEEYIEHDQKQEKYISLERIRNGIKIMYSNQGGVDIEKNKKNIKSLKFNYYSDNEKEKTDQIQLIASYINSNQIFIKKLIKVFNKYYFSFLEINPLLIKNEKNYILDLAVQVDSCAQLLISKDKFYQKIWTDKNFVSETHEKIIEEKNISQLDAKSQASLKLKVLNPNGTIWMLLSGGGASIVLADEIYNLGFGKEIGNYGEYSGNPNQEETRIYAQNIIELLLKAKTNKQKALIIAGGVANFTDIDKTFQGILFALEKNIHELQNQNIKIFVRRGGPNETNALKKMKNFLKQNNIFGMVENGNTPITEVIKKTLEFISIQNNSKKI